MPCTDLSICRAARHASPSTLAGRLGTAGALALGLALAATASAQPSPARPAGGAAAQACEREARQTLTANGTNGVEVSFTPGPVVQADLSNETQTVLRGVARWKKGSDVRSVSYSCNVELDSLRVGLVVRDSTAATAPAAAARPPAEPDLSQLSPAACESSAVQALTRRWPRVADISFDPATRRLVQPSAVLAQLHGSGRAVPAPRSPSTFFSYECEVDPRDGRVLRTRISS
jgi:hypothetical protein